MRHWLFRRAVCPQSAFTFRRIARHLHGRLTFRLFYGLCWMQVVLNHDSPAYSRVYGFQVPTKYAAWLELLAIHLLVPNSSFLGHMCGILAGKRT